MTYSTDPVVTDTVRHVDSIARFQARVDQAERAVIEDFIAACQRCDANALPSFAPMVTDWRLAKTPRSAGEPAPKRMPTLSEVMAESLDYGDGPSMTEAMQLILNAANGMDVKAQAQGLIDRMATTWAKFNTEAEG